LFLKNVWTFLLKLIVFREHLQSHALHWTKKIIGWDSLHMFI